MSFLAPPSTLGSVARLTTRLRRSHESFATTSDRGSQLFDQVGCATCHVRSLTSGASPVAALAGRTFHPFSDFLLHDMGSLGDGIEQGRATGSETRTAPLWGLRVLTTFLHDGRTSSVEEAILAHDGQGRGARERFDALGATDRAMLVAFLRTL